MAEKKDYFDFWKKLAEKNKPNRNFQKELAEKKLPTPNLQSETSKAPGSELDKNEVKIKGILEIYRKPKL